MLDAGDRFEGYVIDDVLGRGGSATVYRAREVDGGRAVALKVVYPHRRSRTYLDRLRREYEFAVQLPHRHIVTMYGAGPEWLAMELLAGGPVTNLSRLADRLTALVQVADALDFCHQQGIVHCDVKPTNILTGADFATSGAALTDFGAAHAVSEFIQSEGRTVSRRHVPVEASLPYTAPELFGGRPPSAASDEYALACTAAEVVTGSPPFTAVTQMALVDQHLHWPPPAFSQQFDWLPRAFDSVLARGMAKDPDARYGSCAALMSAVVTGTVR
ncbi:serine/threonine-protein kinase [Mycolicibacterium thermoresistibile]